MPQKQILSNIALRNHAKECLEKTLKELMEEIIKSSSFTASEEIAMDDYFNDSYKSVNTKNYKFCLDDNGFVLRKDRFNDTKSIYGWRFVDGVPRAITSKVNLRKSKQNIRSEKSVYRKIYKTLGRNFEEWINEDC